MVEHDSTPMVVGPAPEQPGPSDAATPTEGAPSATHPAVRIALVVAALGVAALAILLLRGGDRPVAGLATAPTDQVGIRWSMPLVSASPTSDDTAAAVGNPSAEPSLVLDGDRLVVILTGEDGVGLRHRSATTGDARWERDLPGDALPVLVDDGRALAGSGRLVASTGQRRLVGIDMDDGATTWDVPIGADFDGHVTAQGGILVSGNGQCGSLDPGSGRFLDLRAADACSLRDRSTALSTEDGWLVRDLSGREIATIASTTAPVLVGDTVVGTNGGGLVLADSSGAERTVAVDDPVQWLVPIGDDRVAAWTERAQYLVDVRAATVGDPMPIAATPFEVGGRTLVLDDGTSPVDPLVASGVWSRSPDANHVRVLTDDGTVLAEREVVLDPQKLVTEDGLLLWDQADGRQRLGLYGFEDLAPRWRVTVDAFPVLAPTSSADAVVVLGLDADGDLVLTSLG